MPRLKSTPVWMAIRRSMCNRRHARTDEAEHQHEERELHLLSPRSISPVLEEQGPAVSPGRTKSCPSFVVIAVVLGFVLSVFPPATLAQDPSGGDSVVIHGVRQSDVDGDGSVDLTIIDASFSSDHDRVLVYDGAGDMIMSADWREATDFDDDTWIFDVAADGTAELVAVFDTEGNKHIAYLYDDWDGDRQVAFEFKNDRVSIQENPYWTVRAVADGPWYNVAGSINRNVTFSVDGPIGDRDMDYDSILDSQASDGEVDFEMECRAGSWQHMSTYCLSRLFASLESRIGHSKIRVAVPGYPLPQVKGYVFWPHLGLGPYQAQPPLEIPPPLNMNWETARFHRRMTNMVRFLGAEGGWWLLSTRSTVKGEDNALDFENPFAYYDLARDRDGWAELVIRHVYSPPGTAWYRVGDHFQPSHDPRDTLQIVRYTWDQDNDGYWDYKLGLLGNNIVETVVPFSDFGVVSIPYDVLPQTLTEGMRWDGATFVQVEGRAETSPEGVYDWDYIVPLQEQFIFGIGDTFKAGTPDIRGGFRGEYAVKQFDEPHLYFSPVDRKLHLFGADAGVWAVDDVHRVRYADLDGDGYLDQWKCTRTQPEGLDAGVTNPDVPRLEIFGEQQVAEELVKSLQIAHGILLYGDTNRIRLSRNTSALSLFEMMPPRNHEEWLLLGEQLERHRGDFAHDDLESMMTQLPGPVTEIEGARVEGFRLTEAGFRFVLHLRPGFQVLKDANGTGLVDLLAGSYAVIYDGTFRTRALTAPHITVPEGEISIDPATPGHMDWTTIRATLHNIGLRDVASLSTKLYAARQGSEPHLLTEQEVCIPGEGKYELSFNWIPKDAGKWMIWVEAAGVDGIAGEFELGTMTRLETEVQLIAMPDMFEPLGAYDGVRLTWPIALLLGSVALAAVSVSGVIVRNRNAPPALSIRIFTSEASGSEEGDVENREQQTS